MTDTIIQSPNGALWKPASSKDTVHCTNCGNFVDTPEEVASYPNGKCPDCGENWTGSERRGTTIVVTAPEAVKGEA